MEGGRSYTQIITGLILFLFWNTILINRFFIFRTVFAKCLKNVLRLAWKLTRSSFKAFHKSVPSRRKLYPFASKVCKKTYLNKIFIWENFLSDFLPILLIKRDNCGILRIKNKHMDQIRPSDARIKCRCFQVWFLQNFQLATSLFYSIVKNFSYFRPNGCCFFDPVSSVFFLHTGCLLPLCKFPLEAFVCWRNQRAQ